MIAFFVFMISVGSFSCFIVGYIQGKAKGWKDAKEFYDESDYDELYEVD